MRLSVDYGRLLQAVVMHQIVCQTMYAAKVQHAILAATTTACRQTTHGLCPCTLQGTGDEGSGAALPTDLVVASTPCQAGLALGSNASVTFSMTSSVNPEFIKGVALQLTFPTALWPTVALACHTAAGTGVLTMATLLP